MHACSAVYRIAVQCSAVQCTVCPGRCVLGGLCCQALQQPAQHVPPAKAPAHAVVCTAALRSGFYGSAPVVLPAIPPADAPAFRALNAHLGLGIPDDDIAAAVRRGAALAAATATETPTPYLAAEFDRWAWSKLTNHWLRVCTCVFGPYAQVHTPHAQQQSWRGL